LTLREKNLEDWGSDKRRVRKMMEKGGWNYKDITRSFSGKKRREENEEKITNQKCNGGKREEKSTARKLKR